MRDELLRRISDTGTPAYVYDLDLLIDRVAQFRSAFSTPRLNLLFATMANPRPEILSTLAGVGVGACVNSVAHLQAAIDAGVPRGLIQFTSTGLSLADMSAIKTAGIRVNLDSVRQLDRWFSLVGGGTAGVRINASALVGASNGDRIGIHPVDLTMPWNTAGSATAHLVGLHVYVGTNFSSPEAMLSVLNPFFEAAARVQEIEYVNIGGGVGVDYLRTGIQFDMALFGASVDELHSRLERQVGRPLQLFFEPGRALAAGIGVFLCRVTDVKPLAGVRYVSVDASVAQFPRPFHHPDSRHVVRRLEEGARYGVAHAEPAVVVGRTTFSRDILAHAELPTDVDVDDVLVFEDAGAYCDSMASRFLGQIEPRVVPIRSSLELS